MRIALIIFCAIGFYLGMTIATFILLTKFSSDTYPDGDNKLLAFFWPAVLPMLGIGVVVVGISTLFDRIRESIEEGGRT